MGIQEIKPLKILFLVPSLGMGGMERVCVNYANLLAKCGHHVTVFNLTLGDDAITGALREDIEYIEKGMYRTPNLLRGKATWKDIVAGHARVLPYTLWLKVHSGRYIYTRTLGKHTDYDVEIAFFGGTLIKIINASTNPNSVKFGWCHFATVENNFSHFLTRRQAVKTYREIENIACVSNVVKQNVKKVFGRSENVYTLYNPNNTAWIRRAALEKAPIEKERFTFISAVRIHIEHKGLDRLIEAVQRLNQEDYNYDVWVLGDGMDNERFRTMVEENKIKNIKLLGAQENPYKYMNVADMYLCTSRQEGFSMVMAEALIMGLPMLTTDVSGAGEMYNNGEFGMIVENSAEGIYQGMKRVLDDPSVYEHYQQKAKERADFLDEEHIVDGFMDIIAEKLRCKAIQG